MFAAMSTAAQAAGQSTGRTIFRCLRSLSIFFFLFCRAVRLSDHGPTVLSRIQKSRESYTSHVQRLAIARTRTCSSSDEDSSIGLRWWFIFSAASFTVHIANGLLSAGI